MTYIKCTINISNNIQDNTKGIHTIHFLLLNFYLLLNSQVYGDTNILFKLKLPILL